MAKTTNVIERCPDATVPVKNHGVDAVKVNVVIHKTNGTWYLINSSTVGSERCAVALIVALDIAATHNAQSVSFFRQFVVGDCRNSRIALAFGGILNSSNDRWKDRVVNVRTAIDLIYPYLGLA